MNENDFSLKNIFIYLKFMTNMYMHINTTGSLYPIRMGFIEKLFTIVDEITFEIK